MARIKWTTTVKGKFWYGEKAGFSLQRMGYTSTPDKPWALTIMVYSKKTIYRHFATEEEAYGFVQGLRDGSIRLLAA